MFKNFKHRLKYTNKSTLIFHIVIRLLVVLCLILQIFNGRPGNVSLCILTLILFELPYLINKKTRVELPNLLEIIILLFIFAAEILGEIQHFYGIFPDWDTMLHTINGFLCAAMGFSLIDILNRSDKFHLNLTPIFVALVSFCFSMTVGVIWEFAEYSADNLLHFDMQKDTIVSNFSSTEIDSSDYSSTRVKDIKKTLIYSTDEQGNDQIFVIENGYLDIGLNDTMADLFVTFLGAIVFSILGFFYIKQRDEENNKLKFLDKFLLRFKNNNNDNND